MASISASELKIKGVSLIKEHLASESEAIITVRGKKQYVVMDINHYNYLRKCELEVALYEARSDVKNGKVVVESVAEHIARVINEGRPDL
ncbi:MAG: hypothetical protein OEL55_02140 [Desulfobulbaceae bacterium]|nr:hypothetical protein [Desulfobulbaceae bacterium]